MPWGTARPPGFRPPKGCVRRETGAYGKYYHRAFLPPPVRWEPGSSCIPRRAPRSPTRTPCGRAWADTGNRCGCRQRRQAVPWDWAHACRGLKIPGSGAPLSNLRWHAPFPSPDDSGCRPWQSGNASSQTRFPPRCPEWSQCPRFPLPGLSACL